MSTPDGKAPDNQSYLKSSIGNWSPWTRSPIIPPSKGKEGEPQEVMLQQQKGADHRVTHRHRISRQQYPKDCPPLRVQWFHAVDVPLRRPNPAGEMEQEKKAPAQPKKYIPFSRKDSKAIEIAFQKLADEEDTADRQSTDISQGDIAGSRLDDGENLSLGQEPRSKTATVPVNEDYLFDVDISKRELGPAYWLGPVYAVRRGTWFYQDGSTQRPCDETLSFMLEEGYLKVKAWRLPTTQPSGSATKPRSSSQPRSRPTSWAPGSQERNEHRTAVAKSLASKSSNPNLRIPRDEGEEAARTTRTEVSQTPQIPNTHRLFGAHMNSVVTYQDGATAWILTDDFMSRMSSNMYQRIYGGGHFAGAKVTRGYMDTTSKKADGKDGKDDEKNPLEKPAMPVEQGGTPGAEDARNEEEIRHTTSSEHQRQRLQRQMSSLLEDPSHKDPAAQEEELRRRDEKEIEDDYREAEGDEQDREIEHLVLVTHGIGQRLGLRLESVNFVHDVNTFRKTLKAVYADAPDLRALNAELDVAAKTNCRVQVLPICWRHLLDFPKQSLKHNRKEHDLADDDFDEDNEYPNLEAISVDGVPAVRNLITDLALDILLYQSPAYKDHISRIVLQECNRIYHLFTARNPNFKGKVSMVGHSLGSAIMFDILCHEDNRTNMARSSRRRRSESSMKLDFEVEDFYALGSPIGLFQMLKGRTIRARDTPETRSRALSTGIDDPMLDAATALGEKPGRTSSVQTGEIPASSPKCSQVFNIFHPTDPISYRIEPLISPSMSSLKPQPLPYTKRGIFGAPVGQGLSGMTARVGQSVSSLWSSMSSGIASSLLTRGLGYAGDDPSRMPGSGANKTNVPLSMAVGANSQAGFWPSAPTAPLPAEGTRIEKFDPQRQDNLAANAVTASQAGQHPPTLIESELETLSSGYEKRRKSVQHDGNQRDLDAGAEELAEAEARGKRLRREEEKVRRLNANGRVDYAIQEGAFDINLLAAIASHLSYWADEDVCHFVISQLLSRQRVVRERAGSGGRSTLG